MKDKLKQIYQEVTDIIKQNGQPGFAVFDFDNTCIVNDIGYAVLAFMTHNNLFRDKNPLSSEFENYHKLYDAGQIKEAYEFMAKTLSGFSVDKISRLTEEVVKSGSVKPREEIIELISFLKNNGVDVWIVSASAEILVRQAMKHFNIEANLIGVRNIIADGKVTGELDVPLSMFGGKVDCIKKFIDEEKKPILGAGDSINDLPMLEYCEIKVVVDRQNELAEKARLNRWHLAPFI